MSEPLTSENKVLDEIAAERREQLGKHGWTPEHDDEHEHGELAMAAVRVARDFNRRAAEGNRGAVNGTQEQPK